MSEKMCDSHTRGQIPEIIPGSPGGLEDAREVEEFELFPRLNSRKLEVPQRCKDGEDP